MDGASVGPVGYTFRQAMDNAELRAWIDSRLSVLPEDSIVKLKIFDSVSPGAMAVLNAAALRALAPQTMNIEAVFVAARRPQI